MCTLNSNLLFGSVRKLNSGVRLSGFGQRTEDQRALANYFGGNGKTSTPSRGFAFVRVPSPVQAVLKIMRDRIDSADLGDDGKEGSPHITSLYGFTEDDPALLLAAVQSDLGGVVRLGKSELFSNPDQDVLKVAVSSKALHALNKSLKTIPHENDWPDYNPHVTLAYLKPGTGKKYVGASDVDGMEFSFDSFGFEDSKGVLTEITLNADDVKLTNAWTAESRAASLAIRRAKAVERKRLAFLTENNGATEADWKREQERSLEAWKKRKDEERRAAFFETNPDATDADWKREQERSLEAWKKRKDEERRAIFEEANPDATEADWKREQERSLEAWKKQKDEEKRAAFFETNPDATDADWKREQELSLGAQRSGQQLEQGKGTQWYSRGSDGSLSDPHYGDRGLNAPYGFVDGTSEPRNEPLYDQNGAPIVPRPEKDTDSPLLWHTWDSLEAQRRNEEWLKESDEAEDLWGPFGRKKKWMDQNPDATSADWYAEVARERDAFETRKEDEDLAAYLEADVAGYVSFDDWVNPPPEPTPAIEYGTAADEASRYGTRDGEVTKDGMTKEEFEQFHGGAADMEVWDNPLAVPNFSEDVLDLADSFTSWWRDKRDSD